MKKCFEEYLAYLGSVQSQLAVGIAGCVAIMVGIPLAWLVVYGVGYWGWNPILSALLMIGVPMAAMAITYAILQRKI